jgi:hypothetical protein
MANAARAIVSLRFVAIAPFTPTAVGDTSADLVLATAKMGNSHVALKGAGL